MIQCVGRLIKGSIHTKMKTLSLSPQPGLMNSKGECYSSERVEKTET